MISDHACVCPTQKHTHEGLEAQHQTRAHRLRGGSSGLVPGAGYGAQLSSTGVDGDGQGRYTALHSIRLRT